MKTKGKTKYKISKPVLKLFSQLAYDGLSLRDISLKLFNNPRILEQYVYQPRNEEQHNLAVIWSLAQEIRAARLIELAISAEERLLRGEIDQKENRSYDIALRGLQWLAPTLSKRWERGLKIDAGGSITLQSNIPEPARPPKAKDK